MPSKTTESNSLGINSSNIGCFLVVTPAIRNKEITGEMREKPLLWPKLPLLCLSWQIWCILTRTFEKKLRGCENGCEIL